MPQENPDETECGAEPETADLDGQTRAEDDEIPAGGEATKVVLLPVNPHLVHVYWEMAARDLEEVGEMFSRLGPRAQPVLRFYDTTKAGFDSLTSAGWFEVVIALGAGKWYVRLESPANSYCVDLGLRLAGGSFRRLARSNLAEMPKAFPSTNLEEHYVLVGADQSAAEVAVAPGEGGSALRSASSHEETEGPRGRSQEVGEEASRTVPAYAVLQGREEHWPGRSGASGPAPAYAEPPEEEGKPAVDQSDFRGRPFYDESQGDSEVEREFESAGLSRTLLPEDVERQLAEFRERRQREWLWWEPVVPGREESRTVTNRRADLTEMSERSFRAGLSSGQKSS